MMEQATVAVDIILLVMPHSQSVRINRKRWALSQGELAELLGISRPALTRLEIETESTSLETALGLLIIFGLHPRAMLPGTYLLIEEAVMKRAARLDRRLRGKGDDKSLRKVALLSDMVKRATARTNAV